MNSARASPRRLDAAVELGIGLGEGAGLQVGAAEFEAANPGVQQFYWPR